MFKWLKKIIDWLKFNKDLDLIEGKDYQVIEYDNIVEFTFLRGEMAGQKIRVLKVDLDDENRNDNIEESVAERTVHKKSPSSLESGIFPGASRQVGIRGNRKSSNKV